MFFVIRDMRDLYSLYYIITRKYKTFFSPGSQVKPQREQNVSLMANKWNFQEAGKESSSRNIKHHLGHNAPETRT